MLLISSTLYVPRVCIISKITQLNQYQGGTCISWGLTMTERTPQHLISPSGPNWVGTDSAV